MNWTMARSLIGIALIYVVVLPAQGQHTNPDRPVVGTELQPITRDGLNYLRQLGGHQDHEGNYERAIPVQDALGANISNGRYRLPADWDRDVDIIIDVENGHIQRQDFQFYPQGRGGR